MAREDHLSDSDLDAFARPIRDIAMSAGRRIMEVARRGYDVTAKEDKTPVTEADHAAEEVILAELAALTPNFEIISEEAASRGEAGTMGSAPAWVVDPLDGTREFVDGGTEFSVNIGLLVELKPVFGVIYGPALDLLYWTAGDGKAYKATGDDEGRSIAVRRCPAAGPTAVTSRFHSQTGRLAKYLDKIGTVERIAMSSALKFGCLAEGTADIYPRFGPTCEWDTCAGHAILAAAGGSVSTVENGELTYGKPDFLNPGFIARGAP